MIFLNSHKTIDLNLKYLQNKEPHPIDKMFKVKYNRNINLL